MPFTTNRMHWPGTQPWSRQLFPLHQWRAAQGSHNVTELQRELSP